MDVPRPLDPDTPEALTETPEPTAVEEVEEAATDEVAPVANPRLVVVRGGAETDEVFLFSAPAVIGRFDPTVGPIDVDLGTVAEGSYVSRRHAKITEADGQYFIEDLGSSNGTWTKVNGEFARAEGPVAISDGEEIALGNARLKFCL